MEKDKWVALINTTFSHIEGGLKMLLTNQSKMIMAVEGDDHRKLKDQIDFKLMLRKIDLWSYFFGYTFGAAFEAMEVMIVSFIGSAVKSKCNLSPHERSLNSSVIFAGMLTEVYSWGVISDTYGRMKGVLFIALVPSVAYCLYRQNKLQDALELLNSQQRSLIVLQLESQILCRLGKMDNCLQSYEKLQALKIDSLDVKSNIIPMLISARRSNELQGMMDALKVKLSNSLSWHTTQLSLIEKEKYAEAEQKITQSFSRKNQP